MRSTRDRNDRDDRGDRGDREKGNRFDGPQRKKNCKYCVEKSLKVDFKDGRILRPFLTERGKILPRRNSGLCAFHQREVTVAIKRARVMALLPFTSTQQI